MDSSMSNLKPAMFLSVIKDLSADWALKLLGSALIWIFGPQIHMLGAVFALVFIDTATGVAKAAKTGNLSSVGFFKFAAKLIVYFSMMATGSLVDKSIPLPFAMSIMVSFLAFTEAVSILENVAELGWPVPTKLVRMLKLTGANQSQEKKEK